MPWDRFLIQISYKYTWVSPVASLRLIPLSASSYKLPDSHWRRCCCASSSLGVLSGLQRNLLASLNPAFTTPSHCGKTYEGINYLPTPSPGPDEPVLLLGGEAERPPPVLCPPVPKTHYGYEALSLYCFAGWRGINAAGFGRTKKTSVILWSMVIDLMLISKKKNLLKYWNYI